MDIYGFDEINSLRKEANIAFYKDILELYFNLFFQKFNTKEMRSFLLNLVKLYRQNNLYEKETVRQLKIKYGKDLEPNPKVEEALQSINIYYEKVYNFFQRFLFVIDNVIDTEDPTRFFVPKEELSFDFYLGIQKSFSEKQTY